MAETLRERIERVFGEAAEREGAEREGYLEVACGGDGGLLAEVRGLLAADARETIGALRVEPLRAMLGSVPAAVEEVEPETIGVYRVEGVIGEGGFGTVYRARQSEPVERVVAIKMVRAGMATRDVLRRFARERRTLALLEHPNIARLLDAGTSASGRPYFVMELVRGVPITEYCDGKRLGTRARLGLFVRVCEAIQHAHQRGVIHRDIKPSNVLVAEEEGVDGMAGRVDLKVIDFGIAGMLEEGRVGEEVRGIGHERPGAEGITGAGQFMGTPEYMSPEQADGTLGVVDTRSDIYSLGVLLYQMMAGELPYTRTEVIAATMCGSVEARPVRRPSAVLGARAAGRGLAREVRGDLDWIALRALARRPAERYGSVGELGEDVRRTLADEPILAHAASWGERVRKLVRRHTVGVVASAAVGLAVVAGVVGTGVGLVRAREARGLAETRRIAAEESAKLAELRRGEAEYEAYVGRIAAAAGALEASGPVDLKKWLDEAPRRLRGWEWGYLRGLADQSVGVRVRVKGIVQMVACSGGRGGESEISNFKFQRGGSGGSGGSEGSGGKDGEHGQDGRGTEWVLACVCREEGAVVVVEPGTGRVVRKLGMGEPECVRFSGDGKLLACGTRDPWRTVRVYRTGTWGEQCELRGLGAAWDVEFAPDSRTMAVLAGLPGAAHTVRIHDAVTGDEILETGMEGYFGVSWSSDGRFIACGDMRGYVRVWDCDGFRVVMEKRVSKSIVQGVAFSPDARLLAVGMSDGMVEVMRVPGEGSGTGVGEGRGFGRGFGKGVGEEEGIRGGGGDGRDARATEWEVECGLDQRRSPVFRLAFSPDSTKLASATWGNTVWVWDVATRTVERELRGHDNLVHAIAFAPDGRGLYTGGYDGTVREWRMGRAQSRRVADEPQDSTMAMSGDGKWCATVTNPGRLSVIDVSDGNEVAWVDVGKGGLAGFKFLADGRKLVMGMGGGDVVVVDAWTGERRVIANVGGAMEVRTVSARGRLVAGHVVGNGCVVLDVESGERVWGGEKVLAWAAVRFLDERMLVTHKNGGGLEVWDIVESKRLMESEERAGPVYDAAISPDGTMLGTVGFDGTVALVDVRTGKVMGEVAGVGRFVGSPQFTGDGMRLVTGGEDGLIRFWEVPGLRQMAAIRADRSWAAGTMTPDGGVMVVKSQGSLMRFWEGGGGAGK